MKIAYKIAFGVMLLAGAGLQACGGDDPKPGDDDDGFVPPGGSANDDDDDGASGGGGGEGPSGSGGSFEVPDRPACPTTANGTQPDGSPIEGTSCWKLDDCNATPRQFLEQCSGTCLENFNNDTRITGYDGTLPPLSGG